MSSERGQEPTMDEQSLYLEEVFTDRRVGTIRRMSPVTALGAPDPSRPVLYMGQAEVMTNMGPVPINFDIEGVTLAEAVAGFTAAATAAIEQTARQIQEMRRQAASQLVVPQGGAALGNALSGGTTMGGLGGAAAPRGGKIQMP